MGRFLAALAAIWAELKEYLPQLMAFIAGREWEKGNQARKDLTNAEKAARAAARVELVPDNDILRELRERGLVRMSDIRDEPANRGLDG